MRSTCGLCARIKDALSPNAVPGEHETLGRLRTPEDELVHRVVNDPGRLSESWSQSRARARASPMASTSRSSASIAMVMMMDTCMRAARIAAAGAAAPLAGEPSRYRPAGAKKKAAWLPLVEPRGRDRGRRADVSEPEGRLHLSRPVVGAAVAARLLGARQRALHAGQYIYQFDKSIRAISRPQTEILAARVSAMHQCVY